MKTFCVRTNLFIPFVLSFFWLAAACAQPVPPGPTTGGDGNWRPIGENLKTKWAQQIRPDQVLREYPRPELERAQWQNLNGLWDYAIADANAMAPPPWQGKILVPFCIESSLSGVQRRVTGANCLWYHCRFDAKRPADGGRLLLHFGACDWRTAVFLNGHVVGGHVGGYDPFTFDITPFLGDSDAQDLVVQVFDPTDKGDQPRGKQALAPTSDIFYDITYTPTTGIWQTVWLEPVPSDYIARLIVRPDLDAKEVEVTAITQGGPDPVTVVVYGPEGQPVTKGSGQSNAPLRLPIPQPEPWSPDHPNLYGLEVGFAQDQVHSYFGLRKIEKRKDAQGITRFYLNHQPIFLYGPLDQGYWPDGIYTAPTDEALRHDLEVEKSFGFNVVRKHIKVEPARWYYWADKLGLCVWQDFPSMSPVMGKEEAERHADFERTPAAKAEIEMEMHRMIDTLSCHPSVVIWTIFNEFWGQYDTARVTGLFKRWDSTRLVDSASGWDDRHTGDILDYHDYPGPAMHVDRGERVAVQGEYGGGGLKEDLENPNEVKDHVWRNKRRFVYQPLANENALKRFVLGGLSRVESLAREGLSGAIYTQITDVEGELNGLMTYDREKVKVPPQDILPQVQAVIQAGSTSP